MKAQRLILTARGIEVVGEAADGLAAVTAVHRLRPDVVLMDIRMPVMDGLDATRRILALHPNCRVIMLTTFDPGSPKTVGPRRHSVGMTENLLALYRRAADLAAGIVERVRPDQLGDPTPCTEWNVRMLINHVVTGNLFFVHLATGSPPPERGIDHLGDDPVAAFRDSVRAVSAVFEADGLLDRVVHAPFGGASGRMLVDMRRNELTVHGWDLAKATGQSTDLHREVVAACLASYTASPRLKNREGTPFGVEQPAPPSATDADRLAAFLGRKV